MKKELTQLTSANLEREMHVAIYGEGGYPVIVLPSQNAMCSNWEDFGMVETLSDYLDASRVRLFCLDSVDAETWSDTNGDNERRAATQEAYYRYVCDEVVPLVHEATGSGVRPLLAGTSLGATQAVILMLRRPDLFQGCIALSGTYDSADFFGSWMNDTLYLNAPTTFLPNMAADHPYVDLYNHRQIVLCAGQGAWEDESVRTQGLLDAAFREKGIRAWCDYWGDDVSHDWPWWQKQIRYFLPIVLDQIAQSADEEPAAEADIPVSAEPEAAARAAAEQATAALATPAPAPATKPAAKKPARKTAAKKTGTTKASTAKKTTAAKATTTKKATGTTAKKATATKAATTKAATAEKVEEKAAPAKKATTTAAKTAAAPKATTTAAKTAAAPKATTTAAKTATAKKPAATKTTTAAKKATATKAPAAKAPKTTAAKAPAKGTTTTKKATATKKASSTKAAE